MRVLFAPLAVRSHVQAQAQLAWALRAAGHEVCMAVRPNVLDDVAELGITAVSAGQPLLLDEYLLEIAAAAAADAATTADAADSEEGEEGEEDDDEDARSWHYVLNRIAGITFGWFRVVSPEDMIEDIVAFARSWKPDLVVWDPNAPGGAVAARAVGAAHARLLFGSDRFGRLRETFHVRAAEQPSEQRYDPYRAWTEPLLGRFGQDYGEDVAIGQFTVDPMPSWMRKSRDVHYVPMRYVPNNGAAVVPEWLYEPPVQPRVCVTLGLTHQVLETDGTAMGRLLNAVAKLDVEVIATIDPEGHGPGVTLPDNVRAAGFVPLGALLPGCAAIVHHGGSGTFATALENGIPQIVVPSLQLPEERHWGPTEFANGVAARCAGVAVGNAPADPDAVRDALECVLDDPAYARNAEQLRTELEGMPTPTEIVPAIERLTRRYRPA